MKILSASIYQKRYYLAWRLDPQSNKYNNNFIFDLKGTLDTDLFIQSIQTIMG